MATLRALFVAADDKRSLTNRDKGEFLPALRFLDRRSCFWRDLRRGGKFVASIRDIHVDGAIEAAVAAVEYGAPQTCRLREFCDDDHLFYRTSGSFSQTCDVRRLSLW